MSYPINKSYTTPNGDFYVGMTRKEAETKGIYKKTIGIDFYDIDKDHNGVLSKKEISEACDKYRARNLVGGCFEVAGGCALTGVGALLEIPSLGLSTSALVAGSAMQVDGMRRVGEGFCTDNGNLGLKGQIKEAIKALIGQK